MLLDASNGTERFFEVDYEGDVGETNSSLPTPKEQLEVGRDEGERFLRYLMMNGGESQIPPPMKEAVEAAKVDPETTASDNSQDDEVRTCFIKQILID